MRGLINFRPLLGESNDYAATPPPIHPVSLIIGPFAEIKPNLDHYLERFSCVYGNFLESPRPHFILRIPASPFSIVSFISFFEGSDITGASKILFGSLSYLAY